MNNLVSVIIPIYNVEQYLTRALDSLLSQTYDDWEAILVDDGSTDNSASIALDFAEKDRRFRLIRQANGGLSYARNSGMVVAKGEHLMFLDSDDFLHPQALELCVNAAHRDGSDIVAFTYDRRYRLRNMIRHFLHLPEVSPSFKHYNEPEYVVTDNILDFATEYSHPREKNSRWIVKHCQVWRCMYRLEMVRRIRFVEGINYEDFPWWSEVLLHVRRATILNLPLYMYYPNPRSYILSANRAHKIMSLRRAIEISKAIYESAPEDKKAKWEANFLMPFEEKLHSKERHLGSNHLMSYY